MLTKTSALCATGMMLTLSFGCEQPGQVGDEIQDLQEARANTGQRVQELQEELQAAKQRVIEIEKDLALAKQGITHEVREEREDLAEALQEQREEVRGEIDEAQRKAQQHSQATEKATGVLEDTRAPERVEAEVQSSSRVVPSEKDIRTDRHGERIIVKELEGVEAHEQEQRPAEEQE